MKELWSARIAAPEPNEDAEARLALVRLIRQVRSVKFAGETPNHAISAPAEPPATQPQEKAEPPAAPVPTLTTPTALAPAAAENESTLSPQARRTLDSLLQNPSRINDPLELAELLFLSGRPADAISFYAQALERTDRNNLAAASDRAWILFQLANCLRETHGSKAQETYAQLISEYPDSPWTELARAQSQLLGWYQKDRPQELVTTRQL